jgi:hypothetical protein
VLLEKQCFTLLAFFKWFQEFISDFYVAFESYETFLRGTWADFKNKLKQIEDFMGFSIANQIFLCFFLCSALIDISTTFGIYFASFRMLWLWKAIIIKFLNMNWLCVKTDGKQCNNINQTMLGRHLLLILFFARTTRHEKKSVNARLIDNKIWIIKMNHNR